MITDYISLECLALQLALPKSYLKRLISQGKIPFIDTGNGRLRFDEPAVRVALAKIARREGELRGFKRKLESRIEVVCG